MNGIKNTVSLYWLFTFIILKFIIQYAVNGNGIYELHRDEYLHLDQAKHLAWGYHSVPPFTSWISWIILQLGNTIFWIKFFPALFGAIVIFLVWKTVEALNGKLYACILAATALLLSSMLRLNLLYQPNSPDILFYTLLLYSVVQYLKTEKNKWLYIAALAFAFGFLNKYNILFCLIGLLPALLIVPERKIFANKHFYFAMLTGLVLILPNIVWQYNNHFPVLSHMKELRETQLENISRMDFVKEQFFMFIGGILILLAAFISFITHRPFKKYRFIGLTYIITIGVFIYLRAKGYYAFGLYPVLFAFGAVYLEHIWQNGWKRYLRAVPFAMVLLLFVPMLVISFPLSSPAQFYEDARLKKPFSEHTWEDGKKHPISQDFADMLGWKELAGKVDSLYATIPDKENTIVIGNSYGHAGAINYYSKFKNIHAVSFNADYLHWFNLSKPVHNIIRVIGVNDDPVSDSQKAAFNEVIEAGAITNKYAREYGTKIVLLKGS